MCENSSLELSLEFRSLEFRFFDVGCGFVVETSHKRSLEYWLEFRASRLNFGLGWFCCFESVRLRFAYVVFESRQNFVMWFDLGLTLKRNWFVVSIHLVGRC